MTNLTDARHAVEVSKDTGGDKRYVAGAPRAFTMKQPSSGPKLQG